MKHLVTYINGSPAKKAACGITFTMGNLGKAAFESGEVTCKRCIKTWTFYDRGMDSLMLARTWVDKVLAFGKGKL